MKRFISIFIFCITSLSAGVFESPALFELLDAMNVQHDGTKESIVQATSQWRRPLWKERWEVKEKYAGREEELYPILKRLGLFDAVYPTGKKYKYAVVLGARKGAMEARLKFLKGVQFEELVFIGSQEEIEQAKEFEVEGAVRYVPAHTLFFRPDTAGTLRAWLEENPEPGSSLFVSNQPYVGYQGAVVRGIISESFQPETVGAGSQNPPNITVCLDTVAKWLYAEFQTQLQINL